VNGGVLGPPFPVVHDQLLYLADIEGEVVVLSLVLFHCRRCLVSSSSGLPPLCCQQT
jgi:hypothetical protein